MKVLFASSSIGLGHVVRDFYLAKHMSWADVVWVTSGVALRYLEAKGAKIHQTSYFLKSLSEPLESFFDEGRLKLRLKGLHWMYSRVKENATKINEYLDVESFDGVVADEFWELLWSKRSKAVFITDFYNFKRKGRSIIQALLMPYLNRSLHKKLREFDARIYIGLRPIFDDKFEQYGQLFTHDKGPRQKDEDFVVVNVGGTLAGITLLKKAWAALKTLGLKSKLLGPLHFFTSEPLTYIASAKLLITLAGYSSLIEVSRFKKRAIIVPLAEDFEQMENADLFRERPGYRVLSFNELKEHHLIRCIQDVLKEEPSPPQFIDGAKSISERLRYLFKG